MSLGSLDIRFDIGEKVGVALIQSIDIDQPDELYYSQENNLHISLLRYKIIIKLLFYKAFSVA